MQPNLFLPDNLLPLAAKSTQFLPPAALLYLFLINLLTILFFGADKEKARRGHRRIPERTLFLLVPVLVPVPEIFGVLRHNFAQK